MEKKAKQITVIEICDEISEEINGILIQEVLSKKNEIMQELFEETPSNEKKSQDTLSNKNKSEEESYNREMFEGLKNLINKIKENAKKVNLVFFGSMSAGKTTSINLLLRHLLNYSPQNCFKLITTYAENTFFLTIIEKSQSDDKFIFYMEMSQTQKEVFENYKSYPFKFRQIINDKSKFEMEKEFQNDQQGIKELNLFLKEIDIASEILLNQAKKAYIDQSSENKEITIPIIKIKVPNFPSEFRLLDTPGLSLESFATEMERNLKKELELLNIFIFVNDIDCKTFYNIDCKVLEKMSTYGQPVIYSFYTKGLNLMKSLKEKEEENIDEAEIDKRKFLTINKKFFNRLKALGEYNILFRKIIPIVASKNENDHVRENLEIFIKDVKKVIEEFGIKLSQNTAIKKIREEISKLTERGLKFMQEAILIYDKMRILELREYFNALNSFENYRNRYPDHNFKLGKIYEHNEKYNDHDMSRINYIKKHMIYAFHDFELIILEQADKINRKYIEKYFEPLKRKQSKNQILKRLREEGFVNDPLLPSSGIFAHLQQNNKITSIYDETLNFNLFYEIGMWKKINAKEDIQSGLFKWFLKNKGAILNHYIVTFNNAFDLANIHPPNLLKIVVNLKEIKIEKMEFGFNENDLLNMTKDLELKRFTKEALEYYMDADF